MSIAVATKKQTETDLEARIVKALDVAFPWLPPGSLKHQRQFTFKFGHKVIVIDNKEVSSTKARADVLITNGIKPLAVLELKRPGLALTADDDEQGLSYARMLHPRPPLVVVSNGTEFKLLETHSGQPWQPATKDERELEKLVANAGELASADLKRAVETLMGPGSEVWMEAVRSITAETLADMTGQWQDTLQPFVEGFLIPRRATRRVVDLVSGRNRIVLVEGAPLAGKSSVLREFALHQAHADDMAVLFIEADGAGVGLLDTISGILADALGWQVTADDTLTWLARMSNKDGPALVLAVDAFGAGSDKVRQDIERLTDKRFGSQLRLVVALDDTIATRLTHGESGRNATPIGRRAKSVMVDKLDSGEFSAAVGILRDHRISIFLGGQLAAEFRVPWLLRALAAEVVTSPEYATEDVEARIPPLLGSEALVQARRRFDDDTRAAYSVLAEAVLTDVEGSGRLPATVLQSMETFVIRRKTLKKIATHEGTAELISRGYAKASINADREHVLVARLPELLAAELATLLAHRLRDKMEDTEEAAKWLVRACSGVPLGDVIGAQALFDYFELETSIPVQFIDALLKNMPRREKLRAGQKLAMGLPGGGRMTVTVGADGTARLEGMGLHEVLDADDLEGSEFHADMDAWMILAQLCARQFGVADASGTIVARADPMLLAEVGTAPMALRRSSHGDGLDGVDMHHIAGHGSIVCHRAGIVEAITWSIFLFLSREGPALDEWVEEALERDSLPLLARIDIALRLLTSSSEPVVADWATTTLDQKIRPKLLSTPLHH
jgi:Type I restriction enzyme R protein N terminus (HSDR_N)